jgi:hypothetical protein
MGRFQHRWKSRRSKGCFGQSRILLVFLILCASISRPLLAQEISSDSLLVFRFLAAETRLHRPGTCFNVLEITNKHNEPVQGIVRLGYPEGWKILGPDADTLELAPGESKKIPVRISMPHDILGGISYVIAGEFFGDHIYAYNSTYISIKRQSRWDMYLTNSEVFLSDFRPMGDVGVRLSNTGNSSELIKLTFAPGRLVELRDKLEADSFLYVDLPAHHDTLLMLGLSRRKDLSHAEERALLRNWRASSMNIEASTLDRSMSAAVRATSLESEMINKKPLLQSPLNLELFQYNLLSQQPKKLTAKAFGTILFPDDQVLDYFAGYYNLFYDPELNRNQELIDHIRYNIRYRDPRSEVRISDRLGVGTLHTLSGRGISAQHEFENAGQVMVNVIQNPYAKDFGGFLGYAGNIKNINLSGGLTGEGTTDQRYGHYSVHLGSMFNLGQRHYFDLKTVASYSQFAASRYLDSDTTLLGYAYQAFYRFRGKKLQVSAMNNNNLHTYTRNSGINRSYLTADYQLKPHVLLKGHYYRSRYSSTKYPYNFAYPEDANINENARLLAAFSRGNKTFQLGPRYEGTVRENYSLISEARSRFVNYQPGIFGMITFRMDGMRSISPNASFNTLFYNYDTYAVDEDVAGFQNRWTYSVGINYYDRAFKLSSLYTTGSTSDIYRDVVIGGQDALNQAIHIRPHYERFFLDDELRLTIFANYSYYMPSQRSNLMLNFTGRYNLNRTWNIFSSVNAFRISRIDAKVGRINSNDMNLVVGLRKTFDIQQPRLGYYNLTLVGFNDLNGDGKKSEDEKPISNLLVNISRDESQSRDKQSGFAEINLITDPMGEIYYEKIPEGTYNLTLIPLDKLSALFFLDGNKQTLRISRDMVYYLPLVENYKIRGRIMIQRDPNSNEGAVSPEGIKVTALAGNGEVYSALTDGYGSYVLNVPRTHTYEVTVFNVLGEKFSLERDTYRVQFTEHRTIQLDFRFIEERRGIRFNESEQFFQFNLDRKPELQ